MITTVEVLLAALVEATKFCDEMRKSSVLSGVVYSGKTPQYVVPGLDSDTVAVTVTLVETALTPRMVGAVCLAWKFVVKIFIEDDAPPTFPLVRRRLLAVHAGAVPQGAIVNGASIGTGFAVEVAERQVLLEEHGSAQSTQRDGSISAVVHFFTTHE